MSQTERRESLHHRQSLGIALLASVCVATIIPAVAQADPPNVLLILMDDVGIEHLEDFDIGEDGLFAPTGDLDPWTIDWLRFQDAWSYPSCSPTRAAIQSGRYGFKTGVGVIIPNDSHWGLEPDDSILLAKLLGNDTGDEELDLPVPYTTAAFGKYHMGDSPGPGMDCDVPPGRQCVPDEGGNQAPVETAGYDYFVVTHEDLQYPADDEENRYFHYLKSTHAATEPIEVDVDTGDITDYLTFATVDWFIDWCESISCKTEGGPWFAYVAFFAAHDPVHCPPEELYPLLPACTDGGPDFKDDYYAMIYSMSVEIDRLLSYLADLEDPGDLPEVIPNTLIILASDNGSPGPVVEPPFDVDQAKGTVFQGGVHVPLWIGGDVSTRGTAAWSRVASSST